MEQDNMTPTNKKDTECKMFCVAALANAFH